MKAARFCSIDLVAFDHALGLADAEGLELALHYPKDGDPDGDDTPTLVDLDSWAPTRREVAKFARDFGRHGPAAARGVYSYNLAGSQAKALDSRGVRVYPRLDAAAMADFAAAIAGRQAEPARKAVPAGEREQPTRV